MKIVMVNTTFLPERVGGAELHTLWLAQEWVRMGHEVSVVCGGSTEQESGNGLTEKKGKVEGVPVLQLNWPPVAHNGRWGIHETLLKWAEEFLGKERPDVVHFGLFWDFVTVAKAASEIGIPYTITAHLYSLFCHNGFLLMPEGRVCDDIAEPAKCRSCVKGSWSIRHRLITFITSKLPDRLKKNWEKRLPLARGLKELEGLFSTGRDFAESAALIIAPTEFVRREIEKNGFNASKIAIVPHGVASHITLCADRKHKNSPKQTNIHSNGAD